MLKALELCNSPKKKDFKSEEVKEIIEYTQVDDFVSLLLACAAKTKTIFSEKIKEEKNLQAR